MAQNILYKVLWVEDQPEIVDGYIQIADKYDIELDVAEAWDIAEEKLKNNFNEYSAIILDANCKLKKTDTSTTNLFLGHVSLRLSRIFGENHKLIPWYVLSEGTMNDFDVITSLINTEERQQMNPIWGEYKYIKTDSDQKKQLFKNIQNVAKLNGVNTVLYRHPDVFKYLGKEEFVDYIKARTNILKMYCALYYPEDNLNFEYEGNPLRHVVEYIFRTANSFGILPNDCFDDNDNVVLQESSKFLAGKIIRCFDPNNRGVVKCFMRMKVGTPQVFTNEDAEILHKILDFTNTGSHTHKTDPYKIPEDRKELFFGYALQLGHVIKKFGQYLEANPDKAINMANQETIAIPTLNQTVMVQMDPTNSYPICNFPNCILTSDKARRIGQNVTITSISPNEDVATNRTYPIFLKTR